jgi:polar amino acid transport system substrate-binding protein
MEPVDELPWGDSGVYISRSSVSEADRLALTAALERAARSGQVWRAFQRFYPPGSLNESIRPRRE